MGLSGRDFKGHYSHLVCRRISQTSSSVLVFLVVTATDDASLLCSLMFQAVNFPEEILKRGRSMTLWHNCSKISSSPLEENSNITPSLICSSDGKMAASIEKRSRKLAKDP
ncbi:hypothetical protein CDAR_167691 [Caerostris darwini]|uniref:Uncharacterized protein n=1 Tax=Caerostris darwini TaxID=1538125 RepID=A0AAV4M8G8_9ARAC|nr:hypothetical protein CDAR_167691 [Caerostris darwini]